MSDTYGSGLTFGAPDSTGGSPAPQDPPGGANPGAPNDAPAPDMQPSGAPPAASPGASFGSTLRNLLPGPHYTAPDPQLSPLDQSADLLQQRAKRANDIATNPIAAILAPERVQQAREFGVTAAEQLQKIEQQRSAIKAGRVQAETLGLGPGEASDQASNEDRVNIAVGKAMKGNMRAFQGLQAVAPDKAMAIAPQVHEVVAGHLTKAQYAFDSLSGMQNEGQYRAKLDQLRKDGTLTDLEALGMKVPPTYDAFGSVKASEGKALRDARQGINDIRTKLEQRNTYQPMEKKEAETYNGRFTTAYGDVVSNGVWSTNAASGTRGMVFNGIGVADDLGKGSALASAEQRKELGEEMARLIPKEELEKARGFNRTYSLAEPTPEQKKRGQTVNDNPNVQQGIAEGLASMLRGGSGGANVGLLKIETAKRGIIQALLDKAVTEYGGTVNTLSGKELKPYLTKLTQSQQREVLDGLKQYNDRSIDDRAYQVARRAGALGLDASAIGLGKNEANGAIADALEEGRQAQVARMKPTFQPIGGGDGVLQIGAQRPGAEAATIPGGTQNSNQLPGVQPLQTPVQQAQQPAPSPQPSPSAPQQPAPQAGTAGGSQQPAPSPTVPPGGGAAPVTVAGQQVSVQLPQGATPNFMPMLQRIESGNVKTPWNASNGKSSAKGAFQIIGSTWQANKPAGAPDDPSQATPQQQAEAAATYANKNAQSLKINDVPVTDTTLYVTHNLGGAGGLRLLKADPSADARSVVGEAAARNNPKFFKGRPTVATVLQRYQEETLIGGGSDDNLSKPVRTASLAPDGGQNFNARMRAGRETGAAGGPDLSGERRTPGQLKEAWADLAPAIGSTAGSIAGGISPIPGGSVIGGAIGGAGGQALKNYLKGEDLDTHEIVKQGALGGALGVVSASRPLLGAAARVVGSSAIDATSEAVKGGDAGEIADAGLKGASEGIGGEAFGRALGMVGHKVYSMFASDAQKAVREAAKSYSEATKVLETEPNKMPGVGGAAGGPNPKYLAAETAKSKAETTLKDAGLVPEEAAYAHKVAGEGVPKQEAQVSKPGELEKDSIGKGYQQLERDVGDKGVGAPKASPKLPDGPMAVAVSSKMSPAMQRTAERTEMTITAPAKNWQDKWVQLKDARGALLGLERDALSSTTAGRTEMAKDYRALADAVREQQKKAANAVFGSVEGPKVIDRLKMLDVRYRNLMEATGMKSGESVGEALTRSATLKGDAGREVDRKFRAFAQNDPTALAAWHAMRKAGPNLEKDINNLVAVERIPVLGKLYSGVKLMGSFNRWMAERQAGSPASFADILKQQPDTTGRTVRDLAGAAGARTAVQSDALNGVSL